MFNPYLRFQEIFIEAFLKSNEFFLVSQRLANYKTLFNEDKTPILLSQYADKGLALIHYEAVQEKPYAAMIDLRKEKHLQKIKEMIKADSNYEVWALLTESRERTDGLIKKLYIHKVRKWIEQNTDWNISANAKINMPVEYIFGEVYLKIKFNSSQQRNVPLEDIANI